MTMQSICSRMNWAWAASALATASCCKVHMMCCCCHRKTASAVAQIYQRCAGAPLTLQVASCASRLFCWTPPPVPTTAAHCHRFSCQACTLRPRRSPVSLAQHSMGSTSFRHHNRCCLRLQDRCLSCLLRQPASRAHTCRTFNCSSNSIRCNRCSRCRTRLAPQLMRLLPLSTCGRHLLRTRLHISVASCSVACSRQAPRLAGACAHHPSVAAPQATACTRLP